MNKIILLASLCIITFNVNARVLDFVINVKNNTETVYSGPVSKTISSHNNAYIFLKRGLPFNLRSQSDASKPSFTIEQIETEIHLQNCSSTTRTFRVNASDGKHYDFPICIPSYYRAFIYVVINPDYSVTLHFNYGFFSRVDMLKHWFVQK